MLYYVMKHCNVVIMHAISYCSRKGPIVSQYNTLFADVHVTHGFARGSYRIQAIHCTENKRLTFSRLSSYWWRDWWAFGILSSITEFSNLCCWNFRKRCKTIHAINYQPILPSFVLYVAANVNESRSKCQKYINLHNLFKNNMDRFIKMINCVYFSINCFVMFKLKSTIQQFGQFAPCYALLKQIWSFSKMYANFMLMRSFLLNRRCKTL